MSPDAAPSAAKLRALAAWYREYAEMAGNPAIWYGRVSTAENLERQAAALNSSSAALVKSEKH